MNPGMALHSLITGGHGKQLPQVRKHTAPALPTLPGADPRAAALMTLLKSQATPPQPQAMPTSNPAPNGPRNKPNFPTKRIQSRPTDTGV